jgi:hypothetical protein
MFGSGTPLWLLVVFVVAVAILVAVGSILLADRILSAVGKEHNSTVSPFITVVGLFTALCSDSSWSFPAVHPLLARPSFWE